MRTLYQLCSLVSISFLLSGFCLPAQADDSAGLVMLVSGKLEARQDSQPPRLLKRGSPFYNHDTLTTFDASEAQLRFTDGTLVSLRPDSVFKIDDYKFAGKQAAENKGSAVNYTVSLIKGGFRSISGEIAKTDPSEYKIKTDVATIGVRGTEFSLMLDPTGGLGAATYKGLIYLQNAAGYIEIGDGAEYGYAYIASNNSKPRGEPIRPSFMLNDPRVTTANFHPGTGGPRSSICLH